MSADTAAQPAETRDSPGVVAPPPLIYLAGLGLGFALQKLMPSTHIRSPIRLPLGWGLIAAGATLAATFVRAFHRADTNIDPYKPSTALVTTGPYRLTRNPGYLGLTLVYSGIAVLTSTLAAFATLIPTLFVMDRGVIAREERYLKTKFGEQYTRYRAQTRRWI